MAVVVSTLSGGHIREVPQEVAKPPRGLHVVKFLGNQGPRAIRANNALSALPMDDDGEDVRAGLVVEAGGRGESFKNLLALIRGGCFIVE